MFDRFQQWICLYTTSYEDRRWRILCIVRGEFIQKVQSHWDVMKSSWVYKEIVIQIYYTLRYNNIGQHDCIFDASEIIDVENLYGAPEYIEIVKPWTNGDIDNDQLKDIYTEYPDRVSFPSAGVVNLPPLNDNGNMVTPTQTSSSKHYPSVPKCIVWNDQIVGLMDTQTGACYYERDITVPATGAA